MMQQGQGQYARQFERDWRDWFIMGVVGGTVGYVAVKLAKVSLIFCFGFVRACGLWRDGELCFERDEKEV